MFTIKVAYKNKNVLLGKGIKSFDTIRDELSARFPGDQTQEIVFRYKDQELESFEKVQQIVETGQLKSIKLEAYLPPKFSSKSGVRKELQKLSKIKSEKNEVESELSADLNVYDLRTQQISLMENKEQKGVFIEVIEDDKQQLLNQKKVEEQQTQINCKGQSLDMIDLSAQKEEQQKKAEEEKKEQLIKLMEQKAVIIQKNWRRFSTKMLIQKHKNLAILSNQIQVEQAQNNKGSQQCLSISNISENSQEKKAQINQKEAEIIVEQVQQTEIKQNNDQKSFSVISDSKIQIETKIQNPWFANSQKQPQVDVYQCFYCHGKKPCDICNHQGRFTQNSPFIKLIDHLIDVRLEKRLGKKHSQLQSQKLQEIKVHPEVKYEKKKPCIFRFDESEEDLFELDKQILKKAYIQDGINCQRAIQGEPFRWTFRVQLPQKLKSDLTVNVIDDRSGESMDIEFAPNQEFVVGPYDTKNQSKIQRIFRLFYFDKRSQMQFFGTRFGFSVPVENRKKKTLQNKLRLRIQRLLKKHRSSKNVEYILENLKVIGISQENGDVPDESIIEDIINSI